MNHETTIRHTDDRLYLIEWTYAQDDSLSITSVYTEPGECLSCEHYHALKPSLVASLPPSSITLKLGSVE